MDSLVSQCVLEKRAISRLLPLSSRFTAHPPLQTGGEDEGGELAPRQAVVRHTGFVFTSAARVR